MRLKSIVSVGTVVIVGLAGMRVMSAQGSGGNPILAALESVMEAIGNLQESVDSLSTGSGTLWTAPLYADADHYVRCAVFNVTDEPIVVGVQTVRSGGLIPANSSVTIQPLSGVDGFSFETRSVCKFTVPSAQAVRASACLSTVGKFDCESIVEAR